jgi:UDP-N-acetylglucosamine transferase subunit ALG13
VILVTLGTHLRPMDRLIEALDALAATGDIAERVIIQAAVVSRAPVHLETVGVVPYEQLDRWARESSVMVTHGGPGSIVLALAAGHRPVVVPRDPSRGEHVDDHQIRFVRWLASRRPIRPVFEMDDLASAIAEVRAAPRPQDPTDHPAEGAVRRLREILAAR